MPKNMDGVLVYVAFRSLKIHFLYFLNAVMVFLCSFSFAFDGSYTVFVCVRFFSLTNLNERH